MELDAEEVREELQKNGITAIPGLQTLVSAGPNKVFSGKKDDGTVWIVRKTSEGFFTVEYTVKKESGSWN